MGSQKATTSAKFPGFVQTDMKKISRNAGALYKDPSTEFLPQLNQWTQQGINARADIAGSGNTVAGAGATEAQKILSGGYLDVTKDPNFQRNIGSAMGMASDRFAGSGRVGSGSYAGALGDAATGVAAQMYDQERNRQMGALEMIPQLSSAQYFDASQTEDAGRAMDEDTMARFDWPYARLDRFANTVYGSPGAQNPSQESNKPFSWGQAGMGFLHPLSTFGSGGK